MLANYFNVSTDFLLGLSSVQRRIESEPSKGDLKSIAQYVQLSEASVSKLCNTDDFTLLTLLDFLIKEPALLESILEYFVSNDVDDADDETNSLYDSKRIFLIILAEMMIYCINFIIFLH